MKPFLSPTPRASMSMLLKLKPLQVGAVALFCNIRR